MATTENMAPSRASSTPANGSRTAAAPMARRTRKTRDESIEIQVARLQTDLKAIASTLAGMADSQVNQTKDAASGQVQSLIRQGQHAVDSIQDEFGHMEKQIKDTIRQRPLTAVAGAVAIGFIIALLTR